LVSPCSAIGFSEPDGRRSDDQLAEQFGRCHPGVFGVHLTMMQMSLLASRGVLMLVDALKVWQVVL
jgi:hypothetical protein